MLLAGCAGLHGRGDGDDADRQRALQEVRRVVIAPPAITLDHATVMQADRHTEQEILMRRYLTQKAAQSLESAGYLVVEYDFGEAVAGDDELAMLIASVREDFRQAKRKLRAGEKLTWRQRQAFQADIGKAASLIARNASADAVLLIEYLGAPDVGGGRSDAMLSSALLGLMSDGESPYVVPSGAAIIEAVLLDGVTGAPLRMATWDDAAD